MKSDIRANYSAIESKTICLKAITPVTIHGGAKEGKEPELRLSTVNGMMRYWYDALNNRNAKNMFSSDIFGSAVKDDTHKSLIWLTDNEYKEKHDKSRFKPSYSNNSRDFTILAIKPDTRWSITLSTKKTNKAMLDEGEKALKSAVLFGGFGQRGRHGASSFIIPELEIKDADQLLSYMESLTDYYEIKTEKISEQFLLNNRKSDDKKISWLSTRIIDTYLKDINDVLSSIRKATHDLTDKSLGLKNVLGSSGSTKFASPLHTSIYQYKDGSYTVIITETSQGMVDKNKSIQAKELYIEKIQNYLKGSVRHG